MTKIAIFPGSFSPFTVGHQSVVDRALPLFDKIIISIGINSEKNQYFSIEERLQWIKDVDSSPRNFNYYIIDSRSLAHNSSAFNFDDEWVLIKVIDREPNGDIIFQRLLWCAFVFPLVCLCFSLFFFGADGPLISKI